MCVPFTWNPLNQATEWDKLFLFYLGIHPQEMKYIEASVQPEHTHFKFLMLLCFCRFIEYGEYKENLYGTSLESIHKVLDQKKSCLVDVQPEVSV